MKYLPEYLIRYIIFHEIAHLIEEKHNDNFWRIASGKYKNYRQIKKRTIHILVPDFQGLSIDIAIEMANYDGGKKNG